SACRSLSLGKRLLRRPQLGFGLGRVLLPEGSLLLALLDLLSKQPRLGLRVLASRNHGLQVGEFLHQRRSRVDRRRGWHKRSRFEVRLAECAMKPDGG